MVPTSSKLCPGVTSLRASPGAAQPPPSQPHGVDVHICLQVALWSRGSTCILRCFTRLQISTDMGPHVHEHIQEGYPSFVLPALCHILHGGWVGWRDSLCSVSKIYIWVSVQRSWANPTCLVVPLPSKHLIAIRLDLSFHYAGFLQKMAQGWTWIMIP